MPPEIRPARVADAAPIARMSRRLLLAVDPAARRRGVGLALWRWLETLARRGGIARVELEVRAANVTGRAFYRALGFREVARLRGYYENREDALRVVADLRRRLPASASELDLPLAARAPLFPASPSASRHR